MLSQDWHELPPRRTLIVEFVAQNKLEEFLRFWPPNEKNFMSVTYNASVLFVYPHIDAQAVARVPGLLNWTFVQDISHGHKFCQGPLRMYHTPLGTEILAQAIITHFPAYFMETPQVPTCSVRGAHPLTYALYTAVWTYHLIQLPIVSKYDFFFKVDTDIDFITPIGLDVGEEMESRGCSIFHTHVNGATDDGDDCEMESIAALEAFTQKTGIKAVSFEKRWCNFKNKRKNAGVSFYSNFLGYSTKVILNKDVVKLSTFLYEEWDRGYFLHRWGDQAAWPLFACLVLDMDNLTNSNVCDFSRLRNSVFRHY